MNCLLSKTTIADVLDGIIVFATIGVLSTFLVLAWWNRAHEQIRARFWAFIGVGLMGTLLASRVFITTTSPTDALFEKYLPGASLFLTAALAWLLVTLKKERVEVDFKTVFLIDLQTNKTIEMTDPSLYDSPSGWNVSQIVQKLLEDLGKTVEIQSVDAKSVGHAMSMYHRVLLRCILDTLFERYSDHWDIRVKQYELPHGTQTSYGPRENALGKQILRWENVKNLFPGCDAITQPEQYLKTLAVPIGTKLTAEQVGNDGEIHTYKVLFSHNYLSFVITIACTGGTKGLGNYAALYGYPTEKSERYWSANYEVGLLAEFNRFKMGHPDTQRYRKWVEGICEILQCNFDAARKWERQKERYLFFKALK